MTVKLGKPNKKAIKAFLLSAIDPDGYGENPTTDAEKLQFVDRTFRAEYGHMINRVGYQKAMSEWLSGLPSAINVPYLNSDIVKLAQEWGSLPEGYTEAQEDRVLNEWWGYIGAQLAMLIGKA